MKFSIEISWCKFRFFFTYGISRMYSNFGIRGLTKIKGKETLSVRKHKTISILQTYLSQQCIRSNYVRYADINKINSRFSVFMFERFLNSLSFFWNIPLPSLFVTKCEYCCCICRQQFRCWISQFKQDGI